MKHFYEIKNAKTQETAKGIAKSFTEICKSQGWKPKDCKLIWRAGVEAAW